MLNLSFLPHKSGRIKASPRMLKARVQSIPFEAKGDIRYVCMYVCFHWSLGYKLKLGAAPPTTIYCTLHSPRFLSRNIFCIIRLTKFVLAISIDQTPPQHLFSENLFMRHRRGHFILCPHFLQHTICTTLCV